jgi:polysaccharide export outer membrane protein
VALSSALSACASLPRSAPPPPSAPAGPKAEYRLEPGDVLDVKFFHSPQIDEQLPIRPDGRIALQLVGEVEAAGRTPAELRAELLNRYAPMLREPELVVIVKKFASQRVFVGGEVGQAGVLTLEGRVTALQAILQAGGFRNTAAAGHVVVLRRQGTDQPLFLTLDLKNDLRGKPGNDVLLMPYDIVFVPKTRIAQLNQFVTQYIRDLVPIQASLGLGYYFGPSVFD